MKQILTALMCLLFTQAAWSQGWENDYVVLSNSIRQLSFPDRTFEVTRYGASPNASASKNQQAINKAIDACSKAGGGKVVVPAGTWNTGALRLKSHVNLVVEKGATLLFAFDTKLYPLVLTRWEGLDLWNYSPCIYAYDERDVAITGEGTIDGNGSNETWWPMCGKDRFGWSEQTVESQKTSRPRLLKMAEDGIDVSERRFGLGQGLRPQLINLYKCEGILIEGVTLLRSPFWVIHPLLSHDVTIRGVKIWNEGPNGDGCDPESCERVLIENCVFHTGDDCIAIKSGRNADGRRWNVPSQNIIVRGCTMEDGHGGVVIGSEISGGCKNVFVENCKMDSPNLDRVLRIKTNTCRGGIIENIFFRNVEVGQCKESVMRINLNYEPKEACCRGFVPTVRNVYMENVTCQKSRYAVRLNGIDEADNIYNIHIKDCQFNGVWDRAIDRTGKSHDIFFDNFVVNGSHLLSEAPYKHYSEWLVRSEMQRVAHPYLLDFAKKPRWSYVMGIELESMLDTYQRYGDTAILNYLKEYPTEMIDAKGSITGYKYEDFNLDNVRTARFILRMYNIDPSEKDLKALKTLFKQLEKQPRTKEGVWWHKAIYANQVWLDGIYMGLPYYTMAAAQLKGVKKARKYYDDAVDQIIKTDKRTYDAKTGLWKHAWDETHSMFWANETTGLSRHTWGRALGWYVMAMIEVLDALPKDYVRRNEVIDLFRKAMAAVVKYQDKDSGVWYDVLDVQDSRNYLEATCSSMFAYCLLKGARLGYLDASYKAAGEKAYEGIVKKFIRVNADKTISLTHCCAVSGLGPESNPKRDGSFEYYMSEPVRDNDAKGVGPFVWASLEMELNGYEVNLWGNGEYDASGDFQG